MKVTLDTPLAVMSPVGAQRKKYLDKLDLRRVEDLLFYFPRRYHDLRNFKTIAQLIPGETASVKATVLTREEKRIRYRFSYLKVAVSDDTGVLMLTFFNQQYLTDVFVPGEVFFLNGEAEFYKGALQMVNPMYEAMKPGRRDLLLPVYPLTKGVTAGYLRKMLKFALGNLAEYPEELLPFERRRTLGLANIRYALANIHFPRSDKDMEKARDYLIFHEFLRLQLGLVFARRQRDRIAAPLLPESAAPDEVIASFEALLPFVLTAEQKKVMTELLDDLKRGKLIQRLIQGEVGSGKTVVAVFILWYFARRGFQGCFLSPTEILAEQHFLNWQEFFLRQEIPVALFVGQLPAKEKTDILRRLSGGEIKVVIGTHALLTERLAFENLKISVVDEQHKFGVRQREVLRQKGEEAHYVILSATPIPRSVALTFYGTLDFSTIGEMPKGERRVITYLFSGGEKERIDEFLGRQIRSETQGYFVTPAIEGREDIQSVLKEYERMKTLFPGAPIGLIHGRLPRPEQEEVIRKFREKEILLLMATTVIESGIDVPEAAYIVIDQAERFGLAQLHQLRGRVGRSGQTGYCFLVHYATQPEIMERLEAFLETESGLQIAEMDLKLRGPGDLLGTRQHGILPLRIGNIISDLKILNGARQEAERICDADPELARPEHAVIRDFLARETKNGT